MPQVVPLWTPKRIAERWGSTPETVIALIRAGKLRGMNLGRGAVKPRYKVAPEALADYEAAREVQPPPKRGRPAKPKRPEGFVHYFTKPE